MIYNNTKKKKKNLFWLLFKKIFIHKPSFISIIVLGYNIDLLNKGYIIDLLNIEICKDGNFFYYILANPFQG